jgi:hypothetical protein
MTVIGMCTREWGRLGTGIRVQDGRISNAQAAKEFGFRFSG